MFNQISKYDFSKSIFNGSNMDGSVLSVLQITRNAKQKNQQNKQAKIN